MRRVFASVLAPFRLEPASAAAPSAGPVASAAALAFAVSLGLQVMLLAILALGPLAEPFPVAELTAMGRKNMRPEHDLPAFYGGCFATVVFAWLSVRLLSARLAGLSRDRAERMARRAAAAGGALAAASLVAFAWLAVDATASVGQDARLPSGAIVRLALPGLIALAALAVDHVQSRRSAA